MTPIRAAAYAEYVLVNGAVVVGAGRVTGARPGRVLRHDMSYSSRGRRESR